MASEQEEDVALNVSVPVLVETTVTPGPGDGDGNEIRVQVPPVKHFSYRDVANYRLFKRLGNMGNHAYGVDLLVYRNDYIVRKAYGRNRSNIFWNEIYWLMMVSKSGFTPRIIRIEPSSRTFWMTYCGEPIPKAKLQSANLRANIKHMRKHLHDHYGLFHNDIKAGNITQTKAGKLYLIDFGWAAPYKLKPGYGDGRWGDLHPKCFREIRSQCIKMLLCKPDIAPKKQPKHTVRTTLHSTR